jgi:hypothetical protein
MRTSFRRAGFAIAATALMLAGSPLARAQAPVGDSVVGEIVQAGLPPVLFAQAEISASGGPSGENPTGTVTYRTAARQSWDGSVTCLAVTGKTAVVGFSGTVTFGGFDDPEISPTSGLVRVVDGGGPDSGLDSFELAWGGVPPIPGPTDCSSYPSVFNFLGDPIVNVSGDLVVTDAQAFPTTKGQCKNGSWKTYGVFTSQGACVSYVATGGKSPPGR